MSAHAFRWRARPDAWVVILRSPATALGAADAIYCGLADVHIPAARLAEIPIALADCRTADDVRARLGELSTLPAPGGLPAARPWIDRCYSADRVEDIVDRLQGSSEESARAALASDAQGLADLAEDHAPQLA